MPRENEADDSAPDNRGEKAVESRPGTGSTDDIGAFRQGSPATRWGLSRYLVGRAIGADLAVTLLIAGLVLIAVAVVVGLVGPVWIAVLVGLIGVAVLGMRALLSAVLSRVAGVGQLGELEPRMRRLVRETRSDVRRELRRIGLPSRPWSIPLLGLRLAGRRRARTLERLRHFDVERVVPASRLDDLHMVLHATFR